MLQPPFFYLTLTAVVDLAVVDLAVVDFAVVDLAVVGLLVDLAVELEFGLLGKGASRLTSGNHDSLVLDNGTANDTVLGLDDVVGSIILDGNSPATNLARAVLLVKVIRSHDNDVAHSNNLGDHLYKDFGY